MLADSAFIASNGDIFPCCHSRPFKLGNIYRSTLMEIWSGGAALRLARFLSAHRRLHCCSTCNLLSEEQKRTPVIFGNDHPRKLWLLFGEFCNISCVMCEQDHRSAVTLDETALKRNIDWDKIDEVEFQGGEVLAIRGAREFYQWVTAGRKIKANLITNGLLISDEWAGYLAAGARWIAVSVNAARKETHERINRHSSFERVLGNIARLVSAKKTSGSAVRIAYKFTIVPENVHEIAAAIGIAEAAGCDAIVYGYSGSAAHMLRGDASLRETIRKDLTEARRAHGTISVDDGQLRRLGLAPDPEPHVG
jgi:MoaA/NifB/PqqE/SkfB family radical SAM enzyme